VAVGFRAALDQQAHRRQDREPHAQPAGVHFGAVVVDVAELIELQHPAPGARTDLELGALGGRHRGRCGQRTHHRDRHAELAHDEFSFVARTLDET
jgi:hypothetical protein